jgi:hypothetical protein
VGLVKEGAQVKMENEQPVSASGAAWRTWFDRVGSMANAEVVNATANLVIIERDIYARVIR